MAAPPSSSSAPTSPLLAPPPASPFDDHTPLNSSPAKSTGSHALWWDELGRERFFSSPSPQEQCIEAAKAAAVVALLASLAALEKIALKLAVGALPDETASSVEATEPDGGRGSQMEGPASSAAPAPENFLVFLVVALLVAQATWLGVVACCSAAWRRGRCCLRAGRWRQREDLSPPHYLRAFSPMPGRPEHRPRGFSEARPPVLPSSGSLDLAADGHGHDIHNHEIFSSLGEAHGSDGPFVSGSGDTRGSTCIVASMARLARLPWGTLLLVSACDTVAVNMIIIPLRVLPGSAAVLLMQGAVPVAAVVANVMPALLHRARQHCCDVAQAVGVASILAGLCFGAFAVFEAGQSDPRTDRQLALSVSMICIAAAAVPVGVSAILKERIGEVAETSLWRLVVTLMQIAIFLLTSPLTYLLANMTPVTTSDAAPNVLENVAAGAQCWWSSTLGAQSTGGTTGAGGGAGGGRGGGGGGRGGAGSGSPGSGSPGCGRAFLAVNLALSACVLFSGAQHLFREHIGSMLVAQCLALPLAFVLFRAGAGGPASDVVGGPDSCVAGQTNATMAAVGEGWMDWLGLVLCCLGLFLYNGRILQTLLTLQFSDKASDDDSGAAGSHGPPNRRRGSSCSGSDDRHGGSSLFDNSSTPHLESIDAFGGDDSRIAVAQEPSDVAVTEAGAAAGVTAELRPDPLLPLNRFGDRDRDRSGEQGESGQEEKAFWGLEASDGESKTNRRGAARAPATGTAGKGDANDAAPPWRRKRQQPQPGGVWRFDTSDIQLPGDVPSNN